jgi:hypothetical protein
MKPDFRPIGWLILLLALTGCGSGAVVFAPTPLPPDRSPLRYEHPSGAFSIEVPRDWPVFTQYATTLAAASFAPPDQPTPLLTLAVIRLSQPLDSSGLSSFINRYQTAIRADAAQYKEENRQAMGDGSWRLAGLRTDAGGATRQINTFIERSAAYIGIVEVQLSDDPALNAALQTAVNTFRIQPDASLEPTDPAVLVSQGTGGLDIRHVSAWTTPAGVFYITGEIANYGTEPVVDLPLRAVLRTADGLPVAEAVDVPMAYAVLPGGLAPFSLRFGQGQPALAAYYELLAGSPDWQNQPDTVVYGPGDLSWIDQSTYDENEQLVVSGTVTNIGERLLRRPRATVTVFDAAGNVIAARFAELDAELLRPNESASFRAAIPEIGGEPAQYVVSVQALP